MNEAPVTTPAVRDELAELLAAWDAATLGHEYGGSPAGTRTVYVQDVARAENALGRFMAKHGRVILEALDA